MNQLIISRLKEPSTWRGIAMLATAFGVTLKPELLDAIVALGTALTGLIGIFTTDSPEK